MKLLVVVWEVGKRRGWVEVGKQRTVGVPVRGAPTLLGRSSIELDGDDRTGRVRPQNLRARRPEDGRRAVDVAMSYWRRAPLEAARPALGECIYTKYMLLWRRASSARAQAQ